MQARPMVHDVAIIFARRHFVSFVASTAFDIGPIEETRDKSDICGLWIYLFHMHRCPGELKRRVTD